MKKSHYFFELISFKKYKIIQNRPVIMPIVFALILCLMFNLWSCKKFIEVGPPQTSIITTVAFDNDESAVSAINGLYSRFVSENGGNFNLFNSAITIMTGLSSDEFNLFSSSDTRLNQFKLNELTADNTIVFGSFWQQAYSYLYHVNACLEALGTAAKLTNSIRDQLIGECKFLRGFIYFYLVNLYGDLPLVFSTNWELSSTLSQVTTTEVYQFIVEELKEAELLLGVDYPTPERVRVNKYAAKALLARTFLYLGEWAKAEEYASAIINSGIYSPLPTLNTTFLRSSQEAIWQLMPVNVFPAYNGTLEAVRFIPASASAAPSFYLTSELLNAFEIGDQRNVNDNWVKDRVRQGVTYRFPYKYKIRGTSNTGTTITEFYMVLRLGEQYLINAEAKAQQGKIFESVTDLNIIRNRAGLGNLASSLSQLQCLNAVAQERRVELFSEWGHRWFDLKRTNQCDLILGNLKGAYWQSTDSLYPIPLDEIIKNHNLIQNPGY